MSSVFLLRNIRTIFISPHDNLLDSTADMRPLATVVETRTSPWTPWKSLRYFARNCSDTFPRIPQQKVDGTGPQYDGLTAVCIESYFGGDVRTMSGWGYGRQQLVFNPAREFDKEFASSHDVQKHFMASAIRLQFLKPSSNAPLSSYYAVADLVIEGHCACFGHAGQCTGENNETCVCEHNTRGQHCEECLPLYNNRAWRVGANQQANACEYCDCHGHAVSCHYDVARGHGVCDNCTSPTTGDMCQFCETFYRVNPWINKPTNIFQEGAVCTACQCDAQGTVNNSNLCDKETGDCVCKTNTEGLDCGQCKVGAFNLSLDNPKGCTACDCDPGASTDATCPKNSGKCSCRSNIGGRKCDKPVDGYFVPKLDHFLYEAEFTPLASAFKLIRRAGHGEFGSTISGLGLLEIPGGTTVQFAIEVPATGTYEVVIRYESEFEWSAVLVTIRTRDSLVTDYSCDGKTYHQQDTLELTSALGSAVTKGATAMGKVCLRGTVSYSLDITVGVVPPGGGVLLLDSVVLLPTLSSLRVYQEADNMTQSSMRNCFDLTRGVNIADRASLGCHAYSYSLMAEIYGGAIACTCDVAGSNGSVCDDHSGQCPCKPGMMLLDCSLCKVDHYGFDPSIGCLACDCHLQGAVSVSCSDSGVCDCHPNVIGVKCDSCLDQYYGLYTGTGCRPCDCSSQYAVNNSCLDTGQCHCKPGVDGLNCHQCQDGFFALTSVGCTPCDCHPEGSTVSVCDKDTGRCSCKAQTLGRTCDQCMAGYFGLGNWTSDGCIQCICSGHSNNCTSSPHWYQSVYHSSWDLLTGQTAMQDHWTGVDGVGQSVSIQALTKITPAEAEIVLRIMNDGATLVQNDVFFVATSPFLGNKHSSYGQSLSFVIRLTEPALGINITTGSDMEDVINRETGDVVLMGSYTSFTLVTNISVLADGKKHNYSIHLVETDWHVNTTHGHRPTYQEFLELLSGIRSIRIRAKYTNTTGAMVDLCAAQIVFASMDNSSGIPVNNVEQCDCPLHYTGPSCDVCAPGYTRNVPNKGPFVECISCDCNRHAAAPCDPDTGVCNCTHDATGDHCSVCLSGFYGSPTVGTPGDCQPCMCPGNVATAEANVFASECELTPGGVVECLNCSDGHSGPQCDVCMDGWYGTPRNTSNADGQCLPCQCHGRADSCDIITGICVNCTNDTAGKECDICAPTFFGDAASYSCRPCHCDSAGTTGDCDHRTGQCHCKPNVHSFLCTDCAPNTYNYSSGEGCYPCLCHMAGSYGQGCDVVTGQCVCKPHALGRRCDYCEDTYWQVNSTTGCKSCDCTPEGTANVTGMTFGTCDLDTGQCQCTLPGIVGRTCDRCAAGSKGVYPDCKLCGACYDTWAERIEEEGILLQDLTISVLQLWARYDNMTYAEVHPLLTGVRTNLTNVESAVSQAQDIVNDVRYLQHGFNMSKLTAATVMVTRAMVTKYSASEAQRAARTAQSAANSYLEVAMATKQDMTTTLEDTVVGQVTVDAVNEQLIVVRELATNVSRFSLPTLEEMVVICKAINETSISDVAVNTTLMKAKEGLAMAQEALNMTRLASEEAHVSLEEVREIQYNLGEAGQLQREIYAQLEEMDAYNRTHRTAIEQVKKKGEDAMRLAENTNTSISSISILVDETITCFHDATNDTSQANILAEKALQLVNEAANVRLKNVERLQNLSKELGERITPDSATYASLTEVCREMSNLQQDLADIEQMTDLQLLLGSLRSQAMEMTTMQQELDRLESVLDDLVTDLSTLDPQTVRCTHN
ncbi:hypothetical protein LSAT2_015485 [Lamellibrachia satsuma]|nr:hypothetical protein LSAT2_015485 [Lamellibrachia satsuma]